MITIRKEQYAVFEKDEIKKFEDPTYLHLNEKYPEQCQNLGETKLRQIIRYGIKRAASYEIQTPVEVRKYIDVMLLFGPDFDKDPALPWASSVLDDKSLKDTAAKTQRLYETAKKYTSEQP